MIADIGMRGWRPNRDAGGFLPRIHNTPQPSARGASSGWERITVEL